MAAVGEPLSALPAAAGDPSLAAPRGAPRCEPRDEGVEQPEGEVLHASFGHGAAAPGGGEVVALPPLGSAAVEETLLDGRARNTGTGRGASCSSGRNASAHGALPPSLPRNEGAALGALSKLSASLRHAERSSARLRAEARGLGKVARGQVRMLQAALLECAELEARVGNSRRESAIGERKLAALDRQISAARARLATDERKAARAQKAAASGVADGCGTKVAAAKSSEARAAEALEARAEKLAAALAMAESTRVTARQEAAEAIQASLAATVSAQRRGRALARQLEATRAKLDETRRESAQDEEEEAEYFVHRDPRAPVDMSRATALSNLPGALSAKAAPKAGRVEDAPLFVSRKDIDHYEKMPPSMRHASLEAIGARFLALGSLTARFRTLLRATRNLSDLDIDAAIECVISTARATCYAEDATLVQLDAKGECMWLRRACGTMAEEAAESKLDATLGGFELSGLVGEPLSEAEALDKGMPPHTSRDNPVAGFDASTSSGLVERYPLARGLLGTCMVTGQVLRLADATADPAFEEEIDGPRMAGRALPMVLSPVRDPVSGEVVAVLRVAGKQSNALTKSFTADEAFMLRTLATQAGTALRNSALYEGATRQDNFNKALVEVSKAICAQLDLPSLIDAISQRTAMLIGADACGLFLYEDVRGDFYTYLAGGKKEHFDFKGIVGVVMKTKRLVNLAEGDTEGREDLDPELDGLMLQVSRSDQDTPITAEDIHTLLAAPVRNPQGRAIGVLVALNKRLSREESRRGPPGSKTVRFTAEDEEVLCSLAAQAAVAVENTRMFSETLENSSANCLNVGSGVGEAMAAVRAAAKEAVGSQGVKVLLSDDARGTMWTITSSLDGDGQDHVHYAASRGLAGAALTSGQTVLAQEAADDARFDHDVDTVRGINKERCIMAVPVPDPVEQTRVMGVLVLVNKGRSKGTIFEREDQQAAIKVAAQAGFTMHAAAVCSRLQSAKDRSEGLLKAGQVMAAAAAAGDLTRLYAAVERSSRDLFDADRACLLLYKPDIAAEGDEGLVAAGELSKNARRGSITQSLRNKQGTHPHASRASNPGASSGRGGRAPFKERIQGARALAARAIIRESGHTTQLKDEKAGLGISKPEYSLSAPVLATSDNAPLGALYVGRKSFEEFNELDESAMDALTSAIGTFVEQAQRAATLRA